MDEKSEQGQDVRNMKHHETKFANLDKSELLTLKRALQEQGYCTLRSVVPQETIKVKFYRIQFSFGVTYS